MYSLSKCKKLPFSKQLYIAKPRFALIVCYVICPYYRCVLMIIKGYFIFFSHKHLFNRSLLANKNHFDRMV